MKCWFCDQLINTLDYRCYSRLCEDHNVIYIYYEHDLQAVEFEANITNMFIHYLPELKQMRVLKKIKDSLYLTQYKSILQISYDGLILTPQNVKTKLPTLILFS